MKIIGLDEKEYTLKLKHKRKNKVSKYHKQARELLKELYPSDSIIEELTLPGTKTKRPLYADFFIPRLKTVVEVHGEQHYTYNTFFYSSKMEFFLAKRRDSIKKQWCEHNDIIYVELPYNESREQWKQRIT